MKYMDRSVLMNVLDHLLWDDSIDASNIAVKVNKGVITFAGTVPNYAMKIKIPRLIMPLPGVAFIRNHITVDNASPPLTDENLHSNILKTFDCHTHINPDDINVSVENGTVMLNGAVETLWMKNTVENVVAHVWGVTDISNSIEVVSRKNVTDKMIRKKIIAAMDRSAFMDRADITVSVNHGTVSLKGMVPSWNAYQAAIESALYTKGVTRIKNYLTIAAETAAEKDVVGSEKQGKPASLFHKPGWNIKVLMEGPR